MMNAQSVLSRDFVNASGFATVTNGTLKISVGKFDPSLGTLNGIIIDDNVNGTMFFNTNYFGPNPGASQLEVTVIGSSLLSTAGGTNIRRTGFGTDRPRSGGGPFLFGNSANQTSMDQVSLSTPQLSSGPAFNGVDPSQWSLFTGTGSVLLDINEPYFNTIGNNAFRSATSTGTQTNHSVNVNYFYTPVPEPISMLGLGSLLLLKIKKKNH